VGLYSIIELGVTSTASRHMAWNRVVDWWNVCDAMVLSITKHASTIMPKKTS